MSNDISATSADSFIDTLLPNTDGDEVILDETEVQDNVNETTTEVIKEDAPEEVAEETEVEDANSDEDDPYEKRFKDTQKAFQEEHKENLELKRKLEEIEAQNKEPEPQSEPAYTDEEFAKDFDEDPKAAIEKKNASIKAEMEASVQQQIARGKMEAAEEAFKESHPDYDDVVNTQFIEDLKTNSALQEKWTQNGRSPKAAYNLAKQINESKAFLDDPAAAREALKQEIIAEMKADKSKVPTSSETLADVNSKKKYSKEPLTFQSSTDDTLAEIGSHFG